MNELLFAWYAGLILFGLLGIAGYWYQYQRTLNHDETRKLLWLYNKTGVKRRRSMRHGR